MNRRQFFASVISLVAAAVVPRAKPSWYRNTMRRRLWKTWYRLAHPDGAPAIVDGAVYRFAYAGPYLPVRQSVNLETGRKLAAILKENMRTYTLRNTPIVDGVR